MGKEPKWYYEFIKLRHEIEDEIEKEIEGEKKEVLKRKLERLWRIFIDNTTIFLKG